MASSLSKKEMLVVVFDLINYTAFARESDSTVVFETLNEFYGLTRDFIHQRGGRLIKFIGDAGLAVFDRERADDGIRCMLELKENIDLWVRGRVRNSGLSVNCHVGEVTIGEMNSAEGKALDVLGETVNTCFTLGRKQFLLSPQAFRTLRPESRKAFKKYTPPVVYRLAAANG